jgi:hypothetical protein
MSNKRHTKEATIRTNREHGAGRCQSEICRQLNITALSGVRLLCQRFDTLGLCRPHCF